MLSSCSAELDANQGKPSTVDMSLCACGEYTVSDEIEYVHLQTQLLGYTRRDQRGVAPADC